MNTVTNLPRLASLDPLNGSADHTPNRSSKDLHAPFSITHTDPFGESAAQRYESRATTAVPAGASSPALSGTGQAAGTYATALGRDSGKLTADGNTLAGTVLPSHRGGFSGPAVQVSTFAVDGIQANDMLVVQRIAPVLGKPNVVLYMPEKQGASFHEFNDVDEMRGWLKQQVDTSAGLDRLAAHFAGDTFSEKVEAVKTTLSQFRDGDANAVVGPYGKEDDDIFQRLDDGVHRKAPCEVNGLADTAFLRESANGERTYAGQRPDGEKVVYRYDAYGNLHGEGDKGNYYFQKNALNHPRRALTPLSKAEYGKEIVRTANDNAGMNDLNGLYQEFIAHLANPAYGVSDALDRAGVPKDIAEGTERYLNNPIGSALVDINKASGNWFGKQLGELYGRDIDESEMNDKLDKFGLESQNIIPGYGRARFLCSLAADALKGELPNQNDQREMHHMLAEIDHEAVHEGIR
jgi:hypothetical protein